MLVNLLYVDCVVATVVVVGGGGGCCVTVTIAALDIPESPPL